MQCNVLLFLLFIDWDGKLNISLNCLTKHFYIEVLLALIDVGQLARLKSLLQGILGF